MGQKQFLKFEYLYIKYYAFRCIKDKNDIEEWNKQNLKDFFHKE